MKRIVSWLIWTLIGLFAVILLLGFVPSVQRYAGNVVSTMLSEKLGTEVKVDKVNVLFPSHIVVDDVIVKDRQDSCMLTISRMAARVRLRDLVRGNVNISSAQLFGLKANLYKTTEEDNPNFQFLLDSLKGDDSNKSGLNLGIKSLIVRNSSVRYDEKFKPATSGKLNSSHIHLENISGNIGLELADGSLSKLRIRRLSFAEKSGFEVKNLTCEVSSLPDTITIKDFNLDLPNSHIQTDKVTLTYETIDGKANFKTLRYNTSIRNSSFQLSDFSFILPTAKFNNKFDVSCVVAGNTNSCNIDRLHIRERGDNLTCDMNAILGFYDNNLSVNLDAKELKVSRTMSEIISNIAGLTADTKSAVARLGDISYRGKISKNGKRLYADGRLGTDLGAVDITGNYTNGMIALQTATDGFSLEKLTNNNSFGTIIGQASVNGLLNTGNIKKSNFNASLRLKAFDYSGYGYHNILFDGTYHDNAINGQFNLDDENGHIQANGLMKQERGGWNANVVAQLNNVDVNKLNFLQSSRAGVVSGNLEAQVFGVSLDALLGEIRLDNFSIVQQGKSYQIDNLDLHAWQEGTNKHIVLESDFANADISGVYNIRDVINSFKRLFISKIPTLSQLTTVAASTRNEMNVEAEIRNAKLLELFHDKPLILSAPISISGRLNDISQDVAIRCSAPDFSYDGIDYRDVLVEMITIGDTIRMDAKVQQVGEQNNDKHLNVQCLMYDKKLSSDLNFNINGKHNVEGHLSSTTNFYEHLDGSAPTIAMVIHPSEIYFDEEKFSIEPSDVVYNDKRWLIDHFSIANNQQHLILSGFASANPSDTITADIKDINVDYLSGLLNVNGVEFSGTASGIAKISSLYSSPEAHAEIAVRDFRFVGGHLGNMVAEADWSKESGRIDISAICEEDMLAKTLVGGYVSPANNNIELNIETRNTKIDFLEHYIGSVVKNVQTRANGGIRVFGPLNAINIDGKVVANGDVTLSPLYTTFSMHNDTVNFYPDRIVFSNDSVLDANGNVAMLNGEVTHHNLKKFGYNLIINADRAKVFDKVAFGDDTFCGTVYATGSCNVIGGDGETVINIDARPEKESIIKYNVDAGGGSDNQAFIEWRDKEKHNLVNSQLKEITPKNFFTSAEPKMQKSNLNMNLLIDTNPNLTLRVIMNNETGDYIDLIGHGVIQANYFNKGAFEMYGNYNVDGGLYKMTIQNLIKKEFQFKEGSNVVFGGNPFDATLDLKAMYQINGVSLADLSIGNSFSSNNVRVNCLMNIGGTPAQPNVDFDFEMPTASSNAEQMVRSLINSEEELNQQVIYLLTIGRFYNQASRNNLDEVDAPSQTSLAMQSLLSGTISQQINNVLSSVINTSNWNFGANISSGSEGWNNAEYEGLLSGQLFNNRLLINGQFGYRDNNNTNTSFIGDFDIRYLIFPNGNLSLKMYNQSNDRYFTSSSLNTQGLGLLMKKDFNTIGEIFGSRKMKSKQHDSAAENDSISHDEK